MTSKKSLNGFSAALFVVFFVNVLLGAFEGTTFLSDVGEALVLFVAVLFFVGAILAAETSADTN